MEKFTLRGVSMQRAFITLILGLFISASVFAQTPIEELTPQKRADIKKLMTMTGSMKLGAQFADAIMGSF